MLRIAAPPLVVAADREDYLPARMLEERLRRVDSFLERLQAVLAVQRLRR